MIIKLLGKLNKEAEINKRDVYLLLGIFVTALIIRFLYFPDDIYFAYDQARDAYISLKAMAGDVKIVGPPATFRGVNHGAVFYYLFGPIYYLTKMNPAALAAFLRVYNALGVFLIFVIGNLVFKSKKTGLIAALLYAFSFEQTQYALFIGHPALAVIGVLLFYLGLSILVFRRKKVGLVVTTLGLGLSIQFHFSMINLFIVLLLSLFTFRRRMPKFDRRTYFWSLFALLAPIATYILAELKFNFTTTKALLNFFTTGNSSSGFYPNNLILVGERFIHDSVISSGSLIVFILYLSYLIYLLFKKKTKNSSLFILIWLLGGLLPYLLGEAAVTVYYYSIGGSLSLILLTAHIIDKFWQHKTYKLFGLLLLLLVMLSNVGLIRKHNPFGTIPEINVQDKMLLSNEKKVLDFVYDEAGGGEFSVNALTVPYKINTTWSYLFEWYGMHRYGYLPIWGGEAAAGFEGGLTINSSQSELPDLRFSIFEPTRGLTQHLINEFTTYEDQFWRVEKEMKFGEIRVQKRTRSN